MQRKTVIVASIFAALAVLAILHYAITTIGGGAKAGTVKETYAAPEPAAPEPAAAAAAAGAVDYDQRVLVLDDIEKLHAKTDIPREVKGKLMEFLFSEEASKAMASKTNKDRLEYIQQRLDMIRDEEEQKKGGGANKEKKDTADGGNKDEEGGGETGNLVTQLKSRFGAGLRSEQATSDLMKQVYDKSNEALVHLREIEKSLIGINGSARENKAQVNDFEPDPPKLPVPPIAAGVEGFENMRVFSSF